jgi:hypothetical protein
MATSNYYDARAGKTYCGGCDSGSWTVLTDCTACGDGCCDDCGSLTGKADLTCSRCAERERDCAVEAAYYSDPRWREVGEAA